MLDPRRVLITLTAATLLLAGCQGKTPTPASTPTVAATPTATPTPPPPPAIGTANAAQLRAAGSFTAAQVQRMTWSTKGALWVVSSSRVDTVAPDTGAVTKVLEVPAAERILAVDPGGLAAVAAGATVRLVDVATGTTRHTLAAGGGVNAASFFGTKVVLVSGDAIGASIWDTGTGAKTGTLSGFQTAAPVYNVVVSPDGARSAWVSRATLQCGDAAANTLGPRVQLEDFVSTYAFAPDGRLFATTTGTQGSGGAITGRVQIWDPATGLETRRFEQSALFGALAFAPKEPLLATGGDGFTLWSTVDGRPLLNVPLAEAGKVRQVAFSTDGATLATLADDGSGKIWRVGSR